MKVVILAGGLGTRLSEETTLKPKPMIEIGHEPILWHLMKIYSTQGFNDFVICGGYKQSMIKDYFLRYLTNHVDIRLDFQKNDLEVLGTHPDPWKVTIVDTGLNTMTGGRIKRIKKYVESEETFLLTYGDGLSDVSLDKLIRTHKKSGKAVTVTAVQPVGRFGALTIDSSDSVVGFTEKPPGDGMWINGGFYAMQPNIFDYISGDDSIWEREPMDCLTSDNKVGVYRHLGFWRPMDTMTDKRQLDELWSSGRAPWKIWSD